MSHSLELSTLELVWFISLFIFPPVLGVLSGTITGMVHPRSTIAAGAVVGLVSGAVWWAGWWAFLWWDIEILDYFGLDFLSVIRWIQAFYAVLTALSSALCVWAFARWGGGPWHEREDAAPHGA